MSETYNGCDTGEYIAVPGPQGPQGQKGEQGLRGPVGPEGPQGNPGPMGPQGCQGPKGDRGPRGEKGDKGEPGTPGERGPEGPEGPRGCNGASGKVAFEKLNSEQIAMLRGERGPKGDTGAPGPQGLRGEQGFEGPMGDRGPQGEQGAMGPQGATGPKGDKGEPGERGPKGDTGAPGAPGEARISDQVEKGAAWGGKNIIDYSLNGHVNWVKHKTRWDGMDASHKVENTANGYARNAIVYGATCKNYTTMAKGEAQLWEIPSTKYSSLKITNKPIFNATTSGANLSPRDDGYTIIYKVDGYKILDDVYGGGGATQFTAKVDVTTVQQNGGDLQNTSVYSEAIGGDGNYVKIYITTQEQRHIKSINLYPVFTNLGIPGAYDNVKIAINLRGIMILEGDYRHRIPPNFFYGSRGVGTKTDDNKFSVNIETRNKNLIDTSNEDTQNQLISDYYLKLPGAEEQVFDKLVFSKATDLAICGTYRVYCKPSTEYTFSMKTIGPDANRRLYIAGYTDEPHNGEKGEKLVEKMGAMVKKDPIETFTTGPNTNILIIYIANFKDSGKDRTWHIKERCDEVQLEEGGTKTPFEPFMRSIRSVKLDQQLMNDELLFWSPIKNKYVLKKYLPSQGPDSQGKLIYIDTAITDEELVHTYNGTTYTFIRSKIPTYVEADYPIKAHVDYYTKEQTFSKKETTANIEQAKQEVIEDTKTKYHPKTEFIFRDSESSEDQNFLRLPGGFTMQWKEVQVSSGNEETFLFPSIGKIISVFVTPKNINSSPAERNVVFSARIVANNEVRLLKTEGTQVRHAYLVVIGKQHVL